MNDLQIPLVAKWTMAALSQRFHVNWEENKNKAKVEYEENQKSF